MAEALQDFELSSLHFDARLLLFGGILIVIAGLCVWLGGLRWLGPIAASISALAGLIGVYAFTAAGPALVILPALAGALAAFAKKPVIVMSGAVTAAVVACLFFASPNLRAEPGNGPSRPTDALGLAETVAALKSEIVLWGDMLFNALRRSSAAVWMVGPIVALATIAAAFFLTRLVLAATCASLGTLLIFLGMTMLLLHKGARPITYMHGRAPFFGLIVLAMIGFGAVSQLLLCPARAHKSHKKAKGKGDS